MGIILIAGLVILSSHALPCRAAEGHKTKHETVEKEHGHVAKFERLAKPTLAGDRALHRNAGTRMTG